MTRHVHVLGMDELNRRMLTSIRGADELEFHALARADEVVGLSRYRVSELLDKVRARLSSFSGSIDGIIGDFDFPVSTSLPILQGERGLPGPSLEAVLKCEHKYWSRVVQGEVVPEHTPRYAVFDPNDDTALLKAGIDYPYWMKPVKSFSSYLGFKIENSQDFRDAIHALRAGIGRFRDSFGYLVSLADVPPDIRRIGGGYVIAEEIISASHQATVEGYVYRGEVVCYGIVDSVRRPGESSFRSYEYPSRLPARVQARMREVSARVMRHIGFDMGAFNIEYFWDEARDKLWLLEINPRISRSHAPLFELVEGRPHHEVVVDLALGQRPDFPPRDGRYRCAGKYFIRRDADAVVRREPGPHEFEALRRVLPDARVFITAHAGDRLSELMDQDSYTFELAVVFVGANSHEELRERYRLAESLLTFDLDESTDFRSA
jgi:biotin carboxylase